MAYIAPNYATAIQQDLTATEIITIITQTTMATPQVLTGMATTFLAIPIISVIQPSMCIDPSFLQKAEITSKTMCQNFQKNRYQLASSIYL